MSDKEIKQAADKFSMTCSGSYESASWAEKGFIKGAKWALNNVKQEEQENIVKAFSIVVNNVVPDERSTVMMKQFIELLDKDSWLWKNNMFQ